MSHRTPVCLAAFAVASALSGSVLAQTTYSNAGSGLWNDPLNWNAGVPTSTSQAILPGGTPGSITLGTDVAGYVTVNDNYTLTGGTLTLGSGAFGATNGSIFVSDGFALTLADNSLVAGTSDGRIRLSSLSTPLPASAIGNGIVRLGNSQSGLASATRLVLGGGTGGNGVIVEFNAAAAFGSPSVLLDNGELGGGNFQFAGLDQKFDSPQPLENRNEIVLLRYTGSGAIDLPNPTLGSSPFRYLFVENAGNTFTLSGEMIRVNGGNKRINTVASWNGTTVRIGAPNPGVGNADYLLDTNTTVGLTGNLKANGIGVAAINGKVEVYKANQPTYSFAQAFGGAISNSDVDLNMGLLTGVRGQDAADVNAVSQVEFFNQAQGGAIADVNGVSQYHYSTLVNESARYQVPRGQNMIPLEIITNADTNVNVSVLGAGVGIDVRGDIIKKGPGTLTIISGRDNAPIVAGGVAYADLGAGNPPGYPPPTNYEGLIDVQDGGLVFKTSNVGPLTDTMFDGGTGSTDEARTGVVNYNFANGTSLAANFTAGAQPVYNFKSDVTIGATAGDVVTFDIATGGDVAGKGAGFSSGVPAKVNPALNWNGTLKKTGAGLLVFGSPARVYNFAPGAALQVDAGKVQVDVGLNAPTLTVANNGTLQINAGTSSLGTISGSGTLNVAAGAGLNIEGANTQGALNLAAGSTLGVDIASLATFDSISVSGAATVAGDLAVTLVGAYEPGHSDTFTIVASGGLTGAFANTNAWGMIPAGAGKAFLPDYTGGLNVVLTEFTKVGDVDFDGVINNQDIGPFVAVLTGTPPVAPSALGFAADVDGNGVVNNQDIAPFVALLTGPRPLAELANDPDFAPLIALVPEPASLSLLALGGLALRRRRR